VPIQLPGREERFGEPLPATVQELAVQCAEDLLNRVRGADAYAVLGHSFGAVVAYETVQLIVSADEPRPQRLIVSGARSAWLPRRHHRIGGLTDDELIAEMRDIAGYDDAALGNPELRALLMPTLRGDIVLQEGYRPTAAEPLPVPITAFRGVSDGLISRSDTERWCDVTRRDFAFEELPGGHMHLLEEADAYWAAVRRAVSYTTPGGGT
jgi:surfactin synthase thioesterase subunit